jgi:putative membrane protein
MQRCRLRACPFDEHDQSCSTGAIIICFRSGSAVAIKNYTDHAANERTFLAWLRTGLAIIAFGIVVEKLNLFLTAVMEAMPPRDSAHAAVAASLARLRPYEGLALSLLGIVIIVVGGIRFARITSQIDSAEPSAAHGSRTEVGLTIALALIAAALCVSLALQ